MNEFDDLEKAFELSKSKANDDLLAEAKNLGLIEYHLCEDCNRDLNDCTCEEDEDYYDEDQDEFNDYDEEEDDDDYEIDNSRNNFTIIGSNPFDEAEKLFEESKTKEIENKLGIEINKPVIDNNLVEEYNKIKSSQQKTSEIKNDEFENFNKKFEETKTVMSKSVETKNTTFIRNLTKLNFY